MNNDKNIELYLFIFKRTYIAILAALPTCLIYLLELCVAIVAGELNIMLIGHHLMSIFQIFVLYQATYSCLNLATGRCVRVKYVPVCQS